MPAMPRPKGKATKIAFKILGVPGAIAFKRSKQQDKINKQLLYQETQRVR